MNVYLLTESLVTLFLVAGAWCAAGLDGRKRGYAGWARPLGAGLLFGCAALVRPGLPLLPLALASALLALFGWRRGLRQVSKNTLSTDVLTSVPSNSHL